VITVVGLQLGSIVASPSSPRVFACQAWASFLQSVQNVDIPIMAPISCHRFPVSSSTSSSTSSMSASSASSPRFVGRRDEMSQPTLEPAKAGDSSPRSFVGGLADSDLVASFLSQRSLSGWRDHVGSVLAAIFAPGSRRPTRSTPHNFLIDSLTRPLRRRGDARFLLGTTIRPRHGLGDL